MESRADKFEIQFFFHLHFQFMGPLRGLGKLGTEEAPTSTRNRPRAISSFPPWKQDPLKISLFLGWADCWTSKVTVGELLFFLFWCTFVLFWKPPQSPAIAHRQYPRFHPAHFAQISVSPKREYDFRGSEPPKICRAACSTGRVKPTSLDAFWNLLVYSCMYLL